MDGLHKPKRVLDSRADGATSSRAEAKTDGERTIDRVVVVAVAIQAASQERMPMSRPTANRCLGLMMPGSDAALRVMTVDHAMTG